jgi:TonB family protein
MTKSVFFLVLALLICHVALAATSAHQEPTQTTQSKDQAESVRLSAAVADLYNQGKYDEALPLAKQVVEIERGLGPGRPGFAIALSNLAELYFVKEKHGEAEVLFKQAAEIHEKNRTNLAEYSTVLERLGEINFVKKRYENAAILLERSLALREQVFGSESSQVAHTLHELANLYQVERKFEKAEPLYLRSIGLKEKVDGRTHPNTVAAMKNFACLQIKNKSFPPKPEEPKPDLTETEREQKSLLERARCWLYGFKQNCENESYNPLSPSAAILNGKAIRLAQPGYPAKAARERLSGLVFVAIVINEAGNVVEAKAVCGGYPELSQPAVAAARISRFTPTKVNDQPVQVTGLLIYNFVAQ